MRVIAQRVLAFAGAILFWGWFVVRFAMDWVGRSTFGDDWQQLRGEAMPEALQWLFQTPWWVPASCALALTLWLIWITMPKKTAPARTENVAVGPKLPEIVHSTEWAYGIPIMSIQDAACALSGIEPDGYAAYPRARTLAKDLVGAVSVGWVCSQEAHVKLLSRTGGVEVVIEGMPIFPQTENVTVETAIFTPSLLEDYVSKRPSLKTDWIPRLKEDGRVITRATVSRPQ